MIRSTLARATIGGLRQRIRVAEEGKRRILEIKKRLDLSYENREITRENYLWKYDQDIDGRTIAEWLKYYNSYISYCKGEIRKHNRHITNNKILLAFFSLAMILTLSLSIVFIGPTIVGFVTQDTENASSADEIVEDIENATEEVIAEDNITEDVVVEEPVEENITEVVPEENVSIEENVTEVIPLEDNATTEENVTEAAPQIPVEVPALETLADSDITVLVKRSDIVVGEPVKWVEEVRLNKQGKVNTTTLLCIIRCSATNIKIINETSRCQYSLLDDE
jgi:hypothetical protein